VEAHLGIGLINLAFAAAKRHVREQQEKHYKKEKKKKKSCRQFLEFLSKFDQLLRSMSVCGPIELKFCVDVHDT
jgi:hypothetical protein